MRVRSGEQMMRIVSIFASAATLLLLHTTSGHALSGDAPWCAVVDIGFGEIEWDCHYQTIEQCRPNVLAGNRGFCNLNPYYKPPAAGGYARHPARRHSHAN